MSAEVAIRLILGKIAREEGKRPVYGREAKRSADGAFCVIDGFGAKML